MSYIDALFKKDEDKVTVLDSHKIMGSSGALAAS